MALNIKESKQGEQMHLWHEEQANRSHECHSRRRISAFILSPAPSPFPLSSHSTSTKLWERFLFDERMKQKNVWLEENTGSCKFKGLHTQFSWNSLSFITGAPLKRSRDAGREDRHVWRGPGWSPRQRSYRRRSWFTVGAHSATHTGDVHKSTT